MGQYILRRILIAIPVLIFVSLVIFAIMRIAPGDVATMILIGSGDQGADAAAVEALREQLGLNKPYHTQYFEFMGGILRLDPGDSLWAGRPVMSLLADRLTVTLELAFLGLLFSLIIAVPIGVISAIYQDRGIDYIFRVVSISALAVPNFWLGTLIILALAVWFSWTPPLGFTSFFDDPWKNIQQLFWPALVVGYSNAAIVSRMTRSAMLEVLREDYVRTARAKGLRQSSVVMGHALRNALLPVVTLSTLQLGNLIGGSIITETIFNLPGVGRFLVDAINRRDYPVVQTVIMMSAFVFVALNLIVDVLYAWLDPRIRYT